MCINTKYSILSSIFNVYFIGLNVECLLMAVSHGLFFMLVSTVPMEIKILEACNRWWRCLYQERGLKKF